MANPTGDVRRRLEQYAANPGCEANVRAAQRGIAMRDVATKLGLAPVFGQSPFALQRGVTFERTLFEDDATPLRRALIERKVLPANAGGFVDLRIRQGGGVMRSLEESAGAFERFLRDAARATGDPRMQLPTLVAGAALRAPREVMGGLLAIDVLTVHPQPRPAPITLRVGEVKVYPDRGGFTDPAQLASARAQAGLYVYALRHFVESLSLARDLLVADDGFLVLARPASNQPSVRAGEDLTWQAARARELFAQLHELPETPAAGASLEAVIDAPKRYGDVCLSFCELADHCRAEALARGLPAPLGEDLARFLGALTLHRALELLGGAAPRDDAETDFVRRAR